MTPRTSRRPARPVSRSPLTVAGLAALAVVLAACGSSGTTAGSSGTSGSQGSGSGGQSDAALARSELLPATSYPGGWKAQGASSENTSASFFGGMAQGDLNQLTSCLGVSASSIDTSPVEAASPEYDDPSSNVTVANTVEVYPTTAKAAADVLAAGDPKAASCGQQLITSNLTQQIAKSVGNGASVGQVTVASATVPRFGDNDAALAITVPITEQGVSVQVVVEFVVVQKGRSESVLMFTNTGAPAPANVVNRLVSAAAARL